MATVTIESGQIVNVLVRTMNGDQVEVKMSLEEADDLMNSLIHVFEDDLNLELDPEDLLTLDGEFLEGDNLPIESMDAVLAEEL